MSQENRRRYRENFYTAPLGDTISGVILFKEALCQAANDGTSFVQHLNKQGVLAGVKVDEVQTTFTVFEPELIAKCVAHAAPPPHGEPASM